LGILRDIQRPPLGKEKNHESRLEREKETRQSRKKKIIRKKKEEETSKGEKKTLRRREARG